MDGQIFWNCSFIKKQRLEKCGLSPITLHFSRPLIGGREATVVQARVPLEIVVCDL